MVGSTLGAVRAWLGERVDVDAGEVIVFGESIGVDAVVYAVEPVTCGEHVGGVEFWNVQVIVRSECAEEPEVQFRKCAKGDEG